ncbi:MAG: hypothetical protein K2X38_18145 [Gemmataceae bacterium]|nr:hypothetical protein [Gemmataceae bacterium]
MTQFRDHRATVYSIRLLLRRLGRWAAAGVLGACVGVGSLMAQDPNSPDNPSAKTYLNRSTIQLPIEVEAGSRSQLHSIQLFVREGANGAWAMKETASPEQQHFTFRAPREGEFWFNIVSVDRMGRRTPADVTKEAPALMVVIDSQPPQMEVSIAGTSNEGTVVHCEVRDANPDYLKTRFYFQTRDNVWRPLEPMQNRPDLFCIPAQAVLTGMIRVAVTDLAGNTTSRELNLGALQTRGNVGAETKVAQAPAQPELPQRPIQKSPEIIQPYIPSSSGPNIVATGTQTPDLRTPLRNNTIDPTPPTFGGNSGTQGAVMLPSANLSEKGPVVQPYVQPPLVQLPAMQPNMIPSPAPAIETPAQQFVPQQQVTPPQFVSPPSQAYENESPNRTINRVANKAIFPPAVAENPLVPPAAIPTEKQLASDPMMAPNRRVTNQMRVMLDYQVEAKGPSGVGRIEVWATRDMGQSWQKIHEGQHRQSPLELNLPGEGLFGLTMTASNGRGIGMQPPKAGDAPDMWIEVDATKPAATLTDIRPGTPDEGATMHIRWSARDRNLAAQPIDLFYAATREGPWLPIARNLRNEGYFRWTPPSEAGTHAFIRMTCRDAASNVTVSETQQQVVLGDLVKPKARILDVIPAGGATPGAAPAATSDNNSPRPLQVTNTPISPIDMNVIPRP